MDQSASSGARIIAVETNLSIQVAFPMWTRVRWLLYSPALRFRGARYITQRLT